jgi:flagellar basal body rod protein FlgC
MAMLGAGAFQESCARVMLQVFAIASNALQVQSQKLVDIAHSVASIGSSSANDDTTDTPQRVRIGALPVDGPIENMVALKDVEMAYKLNVAVIETAAEMYDSLLDAVHPHKHD